MAKKYTIINGDLKVYKIAQSRRAAKTEKGWRRIGAGRQVTAFMGKESLAFISHEYFLKQGKFAKKKIKKYILKYKNGRFNLYYIEDGVLKNSSNSPNLNKILDGRFRYYKDAGRIEKKILNLTRDFAKNLGYTVPKDLTWTQAILFLCYPVFQNLYKYYSAKVLPVSSLSGSFSGYCRQPDYKVMIKGIFGYDNPKLVKLFSQKMQAVNFWECCENYRILKKLIPVDYYYILLLSKNSMTPYGFVNKKSLSSIRGLLKRLSPKKIVSLFNETPHSTIHYLGDTVNMIQNYPTISIPDSLKSLKEIHDYVSNEATKLAHGNFELNFPKLFLALNEQTLDNLKIAVPKDNYTLIDWGKHMNNCIGSYGRQVNSRGTRLLGVYKDNNLTYNISIDSNGKLEQFYGKRNSAPLKEDYDKVADFLLTKKIINLKPEINGQYYAEF